METKQMGRAYVAMIREAVRFVRNTLDPHLPIQQLAILINVYESEGRGLTMPELAETTEISQGSISKNVKALSKYSDKDGNILGKGLLRVEPDIYERRRYNVKLTDKGQEVMNALFVAIARRLTASGWILTGKEESNM